MSENKDCNFSVRISEIEMAELNRMSAKMNIPKAVLAREGIALYLRHLSPQAFKTMPVND